MKRIILGLGVLLILAQNIFAYTDAWFDLQISKETTELRKQLYRCAKEAMNHNNSGNAEVCVKANKLMEQNGGFSNEDIAIGYLNTGILYEHSDKRKSYKYYFMATKLGNANAKNNLVVMCLHNMWACKE